MYRPIGRSARKLLSVMTAAAACVTLAGVAGATASSASVTCQAWKALRVSGANGQQYVIRNKPSINHNDQGMCLSNPGGRAAFTVTRSPGWAPSAKVRAYPYIRDRLLRGSVPRGRRGRDATGRITRELHRALGDRDTAAIAACGTRPWTCGSAPMPEPATRRS